MPTLFRNFILIGALQQHVTSKGSLDIFENTIIPKPFHSTFFNFSVSFGALILSHPFEVARVHMQFYQSKKSVIGSLTKCVATLDDGSLGLFRGLMPRLIHLLPFMMSYTFVRDYTLKR